MDKQTFEVVEVHKITDTERQGSYLLDITVSVNGVNHRDHFISTPDDPHGPNPAIRKWMNQHPEFPVHSLPDTPDPREDWTPLSARQLRLGLLANGFTTAQVAAVIDGMPDGADKEKAKIEWEYATQFNRTHPLIASVGVALGLSAEQIDTMWNEALNI